VLHLHRFDNDDTLTFIHDSAFLDENLRDPSVDWRTQLAFAIGLVRRCGVVSWPANFCLPKIMQHEDAIAIINGCNTIVLELYDLPLTSTVGSPPTS